MINYNRVRALLRSIEFGKIHRSKKGQRHLVERSCDKIIHCDCDAAAEVSLYYKTQL